MNFQAHHQTATSQNSKIKPPCDKTHLTLFSLMNFISYFLNIIIFTIVIHLAIFDYFFRVYFLKNDKYIISKSNAFPIDKVKICHDLNYYANLLKLELKIYKLRTSDGFIINLYRLYNPAEAESEINKKKPILLLHGILCTSSGFLTTGKKGLAYYFLEKGFDVWMGDNRCGLYPEHETLSSTDPPHWDWDLLDMSKLDLPCMLDKIEKVNKSSRKISIISHSQGTVVCSYLFSRNFKEFYNNNVDKCVMMAPALYGGDLFEEKLILKIVKNLPDCIFNFIFSVCVFIPVALHFRNLFYKTEFYGVLLTALHTYALGGTDYKWDQKLARIHFAFVPNWISVKLFRWWSVEFSKGKPVIKSIGNNNNDQWFDDRCPDILTIVGNNDKLVDGKLFIDRLKNIETSLNGRWESLELDYDHMDFMLADDMVHQVGEHIYKFLV